MQPQRRTRIEQIRQKGVLTTWGRQLRTRKQTQPKTTKKKIKLPPTVTDEKMQKTEDIQAGVGEDGGKEEQLQDLEEEYIELGDVNQPFTTGSYE